MSRIGKLPVSIPAKVKVTVTGQSILVEGPKGKLSQTFNAPVAITVDAGAVHVQPTAESRFAKAMHGTVRSIIAGMVKGVVEGYTKDLEIQGTGFKAVLQGRQLNLSLGYSHPIHYPLPEGVNVIVADGGVKLKVEGTSKHLVGQVAADIFNYYPVEPYKGKGVRVAGQFVRRKEGKKAG